MSDEFSQKMKKATQLISRAWKYEAWVVKFRDKMNSSKNFPVAKFIRIQQKIRTWEALNGLTYFLAKLGYPTDDRYKKNEI